MPCTDWGRSECEGHQEKINTLTRLLCEANKLLDAEGRPHSSRELDEWWDHHQKLDRMREAAERKAKEKEEMRKKALGKLTRAEADLLGLRK